MSESDPEMNKLRIKAQRIDLTFRGNLLAFDIWIDYDEFVTRRSCY